MTVTVTTDALTFRNDLVLAICKGGFGKHYEAADAFMASHVAPLLAAHQQVTAERDEDRAEAVRLRAGVEAVLVEVTLMATLLLMAGEMSAQERRTARAVAEGIAAKIRTALARAATAREG